MDRGTGSVLAATLFVALSSLPAQRGQDAPRARQGKPGAHLRDVKYGPHERNVLDLWKAESAKPTPLVVYIHGGGFRAGDKRSVPPGLLGLCLEAGISVAAINYRLSRHAPFPAPMLDSGRALQFLRHHAGEWNLDPRRFAATGGSAGAGISLWLGFHDDLADPESEDPVARQSTRLTCIGVFGAQSSYDPRFIKRVVGGRAHEHPALQPFYGLEADELDTPKAHELYEKASPITYVTRDDPPVFLFYTEPVGRLPPNARPGRGIHHINFGIELKKKLKPLGIECQLRHLDDYLFLGERPNPNPDMVAFFLKHFGMEGRTSRASKTFIYKKTGQGELAIHVRFPPGWKAGDRRPGIVFFFGGGWSGGRVGQFEDQARSLASKGMVAALADYRVKRRHGVDPDACVEDAKSALRWLRKNHGKLGIDPGRIVAAGGSAGGHLAACTALTPGLEAEGEDLGVSSRPAALLLFNPVLDLSSRENLLSRVRGDSALARRISPTLHVTRDTPPTLLLYGTEDRLLEDGKAFLGAMRKAGARCELFLAEGAGHGFFNRPPWKIRTLERAERFLGSLGYLKAGAGIKASKKRKRLVP